MVWPFTSTPDNASPPSTEQDPLRNLDPSLREFLERESPVKYRSEASSQPSPTASSTNSTTTSLSASPTQTASPSASPQSPTLFNDNRYAHLWRTYRPLAEVESEANSAQEKLKDVLAAYRTRKASIGTAALENCAMEQFELNECTLRGSLADRAMSCHRLKSKLDRCYNVNQRLLRALGYLSAWDRPPEVEERIQMHADGLYQDMMRAEEAEMKGEAPLRGGQVTAKEEATGQSTGQTLAEAMALKRAAEADRALDQAGLPALVESLRPRIRERYAEKLEGMKPEERALEERALAMELVAGKDVSRKVVDLQKQSIEQKAERKKEGRSTVGDRLSSLLGW